RRQYASTLFGIAGCAVGSIQNFSGRRGNPIRDEGLSTIGMALGYGETNIYRTQAARYQKQQCRRVPYLGVATTSIGMALGYGETNIYRTHPARYQKQQCRRVPYLGVATTLLWTLRRSASARIVR